MTDEARSVYEDLLNFAVFAPAGAALKLVELLPELVAKGRERLAGPISSSNAIGHLALGAIIGKVRTSVPTRDDAPTSQPNPGPSVDERDAPVASRSSAPETTAHDSLGEIATDDLAITSYDSLAASQVVDRLTGLEHDELELVRRYELAHRGRRTILARITHLQEG